MLRREVRHSPPWKAAALEWLKAPKTQSEEKG